MTQNKRKTGAAYEKLAAKYLEQQGYEIVAYNFRCRFGEIDLVARDGEYLVFCEVKYRKTEKKGNPLEAVGIKKQKTISKCAVYYMTVHGLTDIPCRFDVVGILAEQIELIKNAFDYVGEC